MLAARGGELGFGVEHVEGGIARAFVAFLLDAEVFLRLFHRVLGHVERFRRRGHAHVCAARVEANRVLGLAA